MHIFTCHEFIFFMGFLIALQTNERKQTNRQKTNELKNRKIDEFQQCLIKLKLTQVPLSSVFDT